MENLSGVLLGKPLHIEGDRPTLKNLLKILHKSGTFDWDNVVSDRNTLVLSEDEVLWLQD